MADVVVLLPGITRSVLRDTRVRDLWAPMVLTAVQALVALRRSSADLELHDEDANDGITAPLIIPALRLILGPWKTNGYSKMSRYLRRQFAVTPARNFFAYPHDWRQEKRVAGRRRFRGGRLA